MKFKTDSIIIILILVIVLSLIAYLSILLTGDKNDKTSSVSISEVYSSDDISSASFASSNSYSSASSAISEINTSQGISSSLISKSVSSILSSSDSQSSSAPSSPTPAPMVEYERKPKDFSNKAMVDSIKNNYQIISYAYGGLETPGSSYEFRQVIDRACEVGYDCVMVSVGPNYKYNHTFDPAHISSITDNFSYATNKGLKLFVRIYPALSEHGISDTWSTGTNVYYYPDFFDRQQFDLLIEYNREFMKTFSSNDDIIAFSPTFGFLGQSLYDADNFSTNPFSRVTGYSAKAKDHFNSLYGFSGNLPKPHLEDQLQDMKTILWFKTRHLQLTKYAEAVVDECKKYTSKPVGLFAELYSGTFAHQSEAAPQNLDFWLQDCTFGSVTYDMERTFCETHGSSENFDTYDEYYDSVEFYLEEAQMNGAKLIGFYYRKKGETSYNPDSYAFDLIGDIKRLENTYSFTETKDPEVAVYFGANYGYIAYPNDRNFLLKQDYRTAADKIRNVLKNQNLTYKMFGDSDIEKMDFSKYKLVLLPDFIHFTDDAWENISGTRDTIFVFTADFAAAYYDPDNGFLSTTKWGNRKTFDGIEWQYLSRIPSTRIKIEDDPGNIFKGLTYFQLNADEDSTLAVPKFVNAPDARIIAKSGSEIYAFSRNNGDHLYFTTNLALSSNISNILIRNLLDYAGVMD